MVIMVFNLLGREKGEGRREWSEGGREKGEGSDVCDFSLHPSYFPSSSKVSS
jgi:hypothetical protein